MSHATPLHDRRYLDDYRQMIHRSGRPSHGKAEGCQQVQQAVLVTLTWTLAQALQAELTAYLGLARYEPLPPGRTPAQTRSGVYARTLITPDALVPDLPVPKLRRGNQHGHWQLLERDARCWGPLLDQQVVGYGLGRSLRARQETMRLTLGEVLALQACHRIMLALEPRRQAFKHTPLGDPPPVVLVDGIWVNIAYPTGAINVDARGRRRAAKRTQKRVVLTALGVWPDGHGEILSWQIAATENAEAWDAFLQALYAKGVTEERTQLVSSDGAAGLASALDLHLYGVPHQRCLFHKLKHLADHRQCADVALDSTLPPGAAERQATQARKPAILADASRIYATDVAQEIRVRAAAFRATWERREPQAVANCFTDVDQTLSYLRVDFPRALVSLIRTTTLLERFPREVRRTQRDIGMFQSARGCEVLFDMMATRETANQRAAHPRRR